MQIFLQFNDFFFFSNFVKFEIFTTRSQSRICWDTLYDYIVVLKSLMLLCISLHWVYIMKCLKNFYFLLLFQVIICPKLQELLYFMHAFLTAKVASVDPAFMSRGNSAGRVTWFSYLQQTKSDHHGIAHQKTNEAS